ncbi:MAG TPA: endonuclease/exonuclease/phosphatase family protein, partial [Thermomicrobiales bacterium]|nr:endonuclease/exonuclease/phosphatase family protein [Thermomicrobiales bacterium]
MAAREATAPGRERAALFVVALTAIATVFMLQSIRVFVAYLVFVVDQSNRVTLAGTALGVFAAIGLGGVLARRLGPAPALLATAGLLGASRLVMQLWQQPEARVALGGLGIIAWGWLLAALLGLSRTGVASGLALGLGLDIAIRVGFRTVDLPWMPGAMAHALTLLLLTGFAVAALLVSRRVHLFTPDPVSSLSLVAIGPGLAVYHLMTGSAGMARSMLDIGFMQAALLLSVGVLIGAVVAALGDGWPLGRGARIDGPLALVAMVVLGLGAAVLVWQRPYPAALAFVAGVAGTVVLLSMAARGGAPGRVLNERGATTWLTIGMLLQVGLLFTYYTLTGPPLVIVIAWGVFVLGALATGSSAASEVARLATSAAPVVALAVALCVAFGIQAFDDDGPRAGPPLASEFTVMTYNLQAGFDIDNWWSLERQARTIEAESPDVVVLQEVGRGWLVLSPVDQVEWLSRRLGMPYVFGANSDDGLWGNAILSRAPLSEVARHQYATTQNLKRGVITVRVETEAGGVWVFGTHLDNPEDAGEARLRQVNELIAVIGGRAPTLLAGDFNAEPDSDVLQTISAAG